MGSLSPIQIVLFIVAAVSVVGTVIALIRNQSTFSEYKEFAADARNLAHSLKGEVFRDGSDLVMAGNYGKLPAIVRFSNAENTPGLNIRVQAPATFTLSVIPAGTQATEGGRVVVPTNDAMFDARFTTRTDQPTQAKMFLTNSTASALHRLCCSSGTYVTIASGAVELSELTVPAPSTAGHILDHLKHIATLVQNLHGMPGSEKVKIVPFVRERNVLGRLAIIVGAIVALSSVFAATRIGGRQDTADTSAPKLPAGVMPVDATQLRDIYVWRLATSDDFDLAGQSWLRNNGVPASGRIEGDFSGTGHGRDVAYILAAPNGDRRVAILAEGASRYDAQFPNIGVAARIPKTMLSSITWAGGKPPENVDGDGLLITRGGEDPGVIMFLSAGRVIFAVPNSYQNINLR